MASNDNRQITRGIAVRAPAPGKAGKMGGKKTTHVQRVLTEKDPFDEIECHLTPEEVERLSEPDPITGIPVLVGDWTGKATRGPSRTHPETGEEIPGPVVPAEYSPEGEEHKKTRRHKKSEE
jgi:hypothetical protein